MAEKEAKPISERIVRGLPAPEKGQAITYYSGSELQGLVAPRGFGVRVLANGHRSFILNYRINGLERRYTIGQFPDWSVIAAIKEAKSLRQRVDKGDDPLAERVEKRDAATVKELCQEFLDQHVAQLRATTQADYKALIEIIKSEIGSKKIDAVQGVHILKMHSARKDTPYRANRLLAVASAMFNFAVAKPRRYRDDNPCEEVKRFPEDSRERYLSPDELARLIDALDAFEYQQSANLIRLCLLTGCRRGEAVFAQWSQIDLSRGVWTKPSAHTKQKKQHVAPLSDAAVLLLRAIYEAVPKGEDGKPTAPYVFGEGDGPLPITTVRNHWHAIREAAKLADFRLHDIRHNYASLLASGGASLPMVGRLLGHTQAQTTARYTHLFQDPLKKAADAVGNIITGKKPAEVVPLQKRG